MTKTTKMDRRSFLALTGGAAGAALFSGVNPALAALSPDELAAKIAPFKGQSLTVALWGGSYGKAFEAAWTTPFAEKFGIDVIIDGPPDAAKVKTMVQAGNVLYDVCDMGAHRTIPLGREGLLVPLDYSVIDKDHQLKAFTDDWGIGILAGGCIIAFREDAFPEGARPTSVKDFFDTEKFPGRRAISRQAFENVPLSIQGAGYSKDEVYPITDEKIDAGYEAMDRIKEDMVLWESGEQPVNYLGTKEVVMTTMWTDGLIACKEAGIPVVPIYEGAVMSGDKWAIPMGAPNAELAQLFIAWATSVENAANIAKSYPAASTNLEANKKIPVAEGEDPAFNHLEEMLQTDYAWWAENVAEQEERFVEWTIM